MYESYVMNDYGYKTTNIVGEGITTLGAFAAVTPLNFNNNNTISLNTVPVTKGGTGLTTLGSAGTVLSSDGSSMTWQPVTGLQGGTVTSVALSVPSIFTVSGSPVTSSGTISISTTLTPQGSGAIVLASSPTLTTPDIGVASGTSLTLSGLTASTLLTTNGTKQLTSLATGSNNQVLTVVAGAPTWANAVSGN